MTRRSQPEYTRATAPDELEAAAWIVNRLAKHRVLVDLAGLIDTPTRRERIRKAIADAGFSEIICNESGKRPVTYAQAFERCFGEPL
jgi:hypothetical protein